MPDVALIGVRLNEENKFLEISGGRSVRANISIVTALTMPIGSKSASGLYASGPKQSRPIRQKDQRQEGCERTQSRWSKKKFSDGIVRPYRKLTFAEVKVDFEKLQSKMDELEAQFDRATKDLRHGARDAYMTAFTKAAHAGDTQAIQ